MFVHHTQFTEKAIEEAEKGGSQGNIAVGSVVVKNGSIIGVGRNLVSASDDPTAHAEIVALRDASLNVKSAELSGCTLYTTFEPCPMCCGAIMTSGITTVVMGARHNPRESRWGPYSIEKLLDMANWRDKIEIVTGILPKKCADVRHKWEKINGDTI